MCQCKSEARACGLADRFRRSAATWFRELIAEPDPEIGEPAPVPWEPGHLTDEDLATMRLADKARALVEGRELCRKCLGVLGDSPGEDIGLLDRSLCWSCDYQFIEDEVLGRLVRALGRKAARRALRRLVRRAEALAG